MSRWDEVIEDGQLHLILKIVHHVFQVILPGQDVGNRGCFFFNVGFSYAYVIEELRQNSWRKHLELFDYFLYHIKY